jgi:hypothetical protein
MRKLGVLLTLLLCQLPIATASVAGPAFSYGPLTAIASGPSGPASAQLAYISQTRLTDLETPDAAFVILDDATDRTELGPTCSMS